jgi:hypothetical protein
MNPPDRPPGNLDCLDAGSLATYRNQKLHIKLSTT